MISRPRRAADSGASYHLAITRVRLNYSRRQLLANAAIAASRLANEHKREDCHRRD